MTLAMAIGGDAAFVGDGGGCRWMVMLSPLTCRDGLDTVARLLFLLVFYKSNRIDACSRLCACPFLAAGNSLCSACVGIKLRDEL
jgi:hypothetical protein